MGGYQSSFDRLMIPATTLITPVLVATISDVSLVGAENDRHQGGAWHIHPGDEPRHSVRRRQRSAR
jgi:hypothetical protein